MQQADRMTESGKRKGGGLAVFVTNRWCNSGHTTVKAQVCSKDTKLLAVSMRLYYLPRDFTQVIVHAVYIPPLLTLLHSVTTSLQAQHPQVLFLISGDFNHASLSSSLLTSTQNVTCHTRENKTLDLFHANSKESYHSSPLAPLGRSDHNLVHLLPAAC